MVEWNEKLMTGITSIDEQHKSLVQCLNKLLTALKEGNGRREVIQTFTFLNDYVVIHFNDEEELQRKNSYPGYNSHKAEHEAFKNELIELNNLFELHGPSVIFIIATQQKLSTWLKRHISETDMEFAKFLSHR